MTLKSGLNAQLGFEAEVTVGTPITPTVFVPFISETLALQVARIESAGIIAGRRLLASQQWSEGNATVGGDIQLELYDRSIGKLFKAMFGGLATTGSGPYTHTFTPGELTGNSLTVQVGRPNVATGTVDPYTYTGCKVDSWALGLKAGQIATLGVTLAGRQELGLRSVADGVTTSGSATCTSATLALTQSDVGRPVSSSVSAIPAASYIGTVVNATTFTLSSSPTSNVSVNATATTATNTFTVGVALASASFASSIAPMTFLGASVSLGGSTYRTTDLTLAGKNNLNTARQFIGDQYRDESLEAGLREYSGTISSEYIDPTAYRRFVTASEAALVISLAKGSSTCTITCNVRFDGTTPNVSGPGIIPQSLPFKVVGTSSDALGITAVLVNGDATP